MTYNEVIEKINKYNLNTGIKIEISDKNIEGYEKLGISPEHLYKQLVDAIITEYISINYINKVNFIDNPIKSIVDKFIMFNIDELKKDIYTCYNGDPDKILEFIGKETNERNTKEKYDK